MGRGWMVLSGEWLTNMPKNEIDTILGTKQEKRKKRSEDERRRMALSFIERIQEAADRDEEAVKREKPATNKLALLPKITAALRKKEMVGILLDHDVLSALRRYIQPMEVQG